MEPLVSPSSEGSTQRKLKIVASGNHLLNWIRHTSLSSPARALKAPATEPCNTNSLG